MLLNVLPFFFFVFFFYLTSILDSVPLKLTAKQHAYLSLFSFLLLVIFAGFRWSSWRVGYEAGIFDYDSYKTVFEYPLHLSTFFSDYQNADYGIKQMELGYIIYSTFIHSIIGGNYNIYLLITNSILILLLYKGFRLNNIIYGLWFVLFFYASRLYLQYNFILMRQAMAMMIVWLAFHYIIQGRIKKYCFFVLLAVFFHYSALICFLAPLFLRIKINKIAYFTLLLVAFFVNITKLSNDIILNFISQFLSLFNIDATEKLLKYVMQNQESAQGLNLLTFVEAIPFFYMAFKYERELLKTKEGKFYYNMLFVFVFILTLTMNFSFLTRICQYFIYSFLFVLSYYMAHSHGTNRRIVLSLLGLYLLIYSVRYIVFWFYTTPYSFFLFK